MEQIKEFQITDMTLSGFKCYQTRTDLTFGNPTVITGGNGKGKSSIADAIAFAITGLPFFGERGIDRLHGEQNPELFVSLRFTDGNACPHELTRTRQKSRMTITYDGYEIRQHDLTDLFGEKDVFLSIFNPLYFIEELGDDGKKLLERYLPTISHEEVLSQLNDSVRASLEHESILSPEVYLKKRREEIRKLEDGVIYLTGQRDLAEIRQRDGKQRLTELQEKYRSLSEERDALEAKRFEGLDRAAMQSQLVELSGRYDELSQDREESGGFQAGKKLAELHQKLGQRSGEQYAPKYAQPIAEAATRVKELGARYKREAAILKGFQVGTVCPTCHRTVTETDLPAVQAELKKAVNTIVAQGQEQKAQLDELQALEQKAEETFLQFQKDDVDRLTQEIESLRQQMEQQSEAHSAAGVQRKSELEQLRSQIQSLTSDMEYGTLTQAEYDRLIACREELRDCEAELKAAQKISATDAEDFDGKIADSKACIAEKKRLLADAALYVGKRAELTFSKLKMNRVEVSLYDVVKSTGEVKDAFKFNYNGRRYDRLSLSEKIRAGMELSELMKRLTGRNYPVFVDNMESVDDLANVRPTGQIIMAKCVHGAALSVKAAGQPQMQKAA